MGQRSATETLFAIVAAFVEKRTWTQAELARRLETKPETIRKHLQELKAGGFKLEREEDHPHVYWSVPKNWFPGMLPFKADEVPDLLRHLGRAPRGALRTRLVEAVLSRLSNLGPAAQALDDGAVHAPAVGDDEERWLSIIEDAIAKKSALKLRYFTASRKDVTWRHVSPHRVDLGRRPSIIATCHKAGELRRFRISNVLDARIDGTVPFRKAAPGALARLDAETFAGFRVEGPIVACAFSVRDPEATWVAGNLPDERIRHDATTGGARFQIETSAVDMLARFVVGLGDAATPETPELARAVAKIARGALANAER